MLQTFVICRLKRRRLKQRIKDMILESRNENGALYAIRKNKENNSTSIYLEYCEIYQRIFANNELKIGAPRRT